MMKKLAAILEIMLLLSIAIGVASAAKFMYKVEHTAQMQQQH